MWIVIVKLAAGAGGLMGRVASGARRSLLAAVIAFAIPLGSPRAAETTQYTYDALGRVTSAIDAGGKKVVYTYDSAGNRTRVSNGAEFTEIIPTGWSASSNAGTTGMSATNGLRDGEFNALASIVTTNTETNAWIKADLGSVKTVNHIDVAAALASAVGAGPEDVNDTALEYSTDGTKWSFAATVNSVSPGTTRTVALGGISLRYLRIRRLVSGQVALGDLRLYSAAVANSPLIAEPDSITTSGDVTFDPRANDRDLDNASYTLTITAVETPSHGTATPNSGASITYRPTAGYLGGDSFAYTISDGHNGIASARVSVMVRSSTNHVPVAVDDAVTVSDRASAGVDGVNNLRPINNDYDADGDVLSITGTTAPGHGSISVVGSNVIQYQPTTSYGGADSFTYTISDGHSGSATATINLTVANTNPVAGADNVSVSRNGSVTFDPKLNDSDPNGDTITVASVTTAAAGAAVLNGNQTITYTPNPGGAVGADNFTYSLGDGRSGVATGIVNVAIALNKAPTAVGDNIAAGGSPVTFDPRANDIDTDYDALTVVGVTAPAHGTAEITSAGGRVVYTATSGYTGSDTFSYTVTDGAATSSATVAVNSLNAEYFVVAGGGGGGGWVQGGGGGGGVRQGLTQVALSSALSVAVGAGGASGASGSGSSLGAVASAAGGGTAATAGGSGGGGNGYSSGFGAGASGQGFNGGAGSTAYNATGGGGGAGGPGAAATAWSGAGGPGVDSDFSGTTTNYAAGGGGGGWYDAETDTQAVPGAPGGASATGGGYALLWFSAWDAPANRGGGGGGGYGAGGSGIVMVRYLGGPKATGGTITQSGGYTLHTFTAGGTLTVTTSNAAPTAVNDAIALFPNGEITFDPRINDTDPTNDALKVVAVGAPSHGTAAVSWNGARITYHPTSAYAGSDSFTYTIADNQGALATATVSVTVQTSGVYEYLVVAGGGGGGGAGNGGGGGGGGGGVLNRTVALASGSYAVTIGAGGGNEVNGANSSLASIAVAMGGGKGSRGNGDWWAGNGGSGGGGGGVAAGYGLGQLAQGSDGAAGAGGVGGGGGGASGAGSSGASNGNGGQGLASTISGTSITYGSGGGGAAGGVGGSGAGNSGSTGSSGTANRGGGGGGGSGAGGGSGGSGVVIIRYYGSQTATGGTVTSSGGYTIHTFTSSGSFVAP